MDSVGSEPRFAGDSSSGRTTDSGSVSRGSNPLSPASGRSENALPEPARRPVRLAAKDTALSRRRSRVRIPYGLPTSAFRSLGAFVYRLGYHPFKVERRVRFPYALPLPRPFPFASRKKLAKDRKNGKRKGAEAQRAQWKWICQLRPAIGFSRSPLEMGLSRMIPPRRRRFLL